MREDSLGSKTRNGQFMIYKVGFRGYAFIVCFVLLFSSKV